jgi:hypothetical protein
MHRTVLIDLAPKALRNLNFNELSPLICPHGDQG